MLRISLCALLVLAGCSSNGTPSSYVPNASTNVRYLSSSSSAGQYIKHVVIIVQENRSFENLFAGFPGADAPMTGNFHGKTIPLHTVDFVPLANLDHYFVPAYKSWDHGKMDGFDGSYSGLTPKFPFAHLERKEVAPYWTMAHQYVLADHMFPTQFGPSFTGHLTLISGTTDLNPQKAEVNNPIGGPWGCDASPGTYTFTMNPEHRITTGPFPCFTQFNTMANPLDAAGVSWRYYAPPYSGDDANKGGVLWSTFSAIKSVRYGPDWSNVVRQTQVLSDAANGALPAVSWVIPDWQWSDHTSSGSDLGPSWVSAVVNAIGNGPDWKSTAIVVVWDDWGGWYDNVAPPQRDFRGLGIRVGCLIISPYVTPHVSHTVYEFGSILHFVEDVFGLQAIGPTSKGYTDSRATSLVGDFDFTQAPRAFTPIASKYPPSTFVRQRPSMRPPDTDL
jgi:phospholipase C